MSLLLRRARATDLPRIAELSEQLGYPVSREALAGRFSRITSDEEHAVFVAEGEGGRLVGWTHASPRRLLESEAFMEIEALVVDASARRQGVGRALISEVERWALGRGFPTIRVRSNVLRKEAHDFYPSVGFTRIKTQHTYEKHLGRP